MGFVDDYCGGYESLAMFTNSDGEVDFEAAYDAQMPDSDDGGGYRLMDPFERAMTYKFKHEIRKYERQNRHKKLAGWKDTGRKTQHGKPIYQGHCSFCNKQCTVPFAPVVDGREPLCKACLEEENAETDEATDLGDEDTGEESDLEPEYKESLQGLQLVNSQVPGTVRDAGHNEQHKGRGRDQDNQKGCGKGQHTKPRGPPLPGWTATGNTTHYGKPIYEGHCTSCNKQCTVPFAPVAGASPPVCKQCLGQPGSRAAAGSSSATAAANSGGMILAAIAGTLQQMREEDIDVDAELTEQ